MRKLNKKPRKKNMSTHQMCSSCAECSWASCASSNNSSVTRKRSAAMPKLMSATCKVLHRRDEEHGRLGDAHREAEDDHRDARPADEAHGVADDMLWRCWDLLLEVHIVYRSELSSSAGGQ